MSVVREIVALTVYVSVRVNVALMGNVFASRMENASVLALPVV